VLTLHTHGTMLHLRAAAARYRLATTQSEYFPDELHQTGSAPLVLPAATLRDLLARTVYAAGRDDVRPFLNGVYLVAEGDTLTAVATDGHRLATRTALLEQPAHFSAILPNRLVVALTKHLHDGPAQLYVTAHSCTVITSGVRVSGSLIAGRYPDWQRVIPRDAGRHRVVLTAAALIRAIQCCRATTDDHRGITLTAGAGELSMHSHYGDGEGDTSLGIDYHGEPTTIGINADYLITALQAAPEAMIELGWQTQDTPITIGCADGRYIATIMLMRV